MRHQSSSRRYRHWANAAPTRDTAVRVGEKDVYDPNNAADIAEYLTILRYRQR